MFSLTLNVTSVTSKENFYESFPFSYSLSSFQALREILQFWWYKDVHVEFYPILFYCISPFHFSPARKVLKNTPLSVSISIKYFTPRKSEFFVFCSTKVPFSFSFSYRFTTVKIATSYFIKKKKERKKETSKDVRQLPRKIQFSRWMKQRVCLRHWNCLN